MWAIEAYAVPDEASYLHVAVSPVVTVIVMLVLPDGSEDEVVLVTEGGWVSCCTFVVSNMAVAVVFPVTVTLHVTLFVEVHPDHEVKVEPEAAAAVSAIWVPEVMVDCEQVVPQEIDPPVTVPEPVPDFETVSVYVVGLEPSACDVGPSEYIWLISPDERVRLYARTSWIKPTNGKPPPA